MTGGGPADLAGAAYEAVRSLNHVTIPGRGEIADHHELCSVLANLAALLHITPQALHQLGRWLADEQQAGRLAVVGGEHEGDSAAAAAAIGSALSLAAASCAAAARRVDDAHQICADLVRRDRPDRPARRAVTTGSAQYEDGTVIQARPEPGF